MTKNYYDENYDEYFKNTIDADMSEMISKFLAYLKPGARILDAGCGVGRDTKVFLQKGYEVDAFDSSIQMVRLSTEYTGQMTKLLRFEDLDYVDEFDGIWACASLLHVSREDLPNVFRRLERALRKGGVLYASFKVGDDYSEGGRDFTCFSQDEFTFFEPMRDFLKISSVVITKDSKKNTEMTEWINFFCLVCK
ncbi:MAG: SAM-dependent methyltransferase [Firmicutes bacterium HGW-Firmicutes-20]|jgi:SAM-dependent methyltransferase|nr:MAG: SAM-dependent methyltransferase [Firmicutes bacterium HGW-Firmicutes-20]PKM70242.1 MAG: SAM-dependent methyltransferase [Firmicutes bacterium HGW-Firmicutes-19]